MGTFFRGNWVYIFIGFAVVIVVVLGYFITNRLQILKTPQTVTEQPTQTGEDRTEISFSLDQVTPAPSTVPSCISLAVTPNQGSAPFTASFESKAVGTIGENLIFHFNFGDEQEQTIERLVTNDTGREDQNITHTYTQPGNFTAILTVEDSKGISEVTCQTQIAVGGVVTSLVPSNTPQPIALGSTLTPTPRLPSPTTTPRINTPTPTRRISPTPEEVFPTTIIDDSIPAPEVPTAGGFAPTVAAGIGGIVIILLSILL